MASRPAILATLLGASIGVPYVISRTTDDGGIGSWFGASAAGKQQSKAQLNSLTASPIQRDSRPPLEGMPVRSLEEVIRLDVTKEWVYARWPRKSTGLADPELFGVRVPLVTGTRITDLAGSLTYYFDAQGQVQHLSFRGRTADPSQLIRLLVQRYNFRPAENAAAGEQVYEVTWNGKAQSALRAYPAPVLKAASPHTSYVVELELARAGTNRYLKRRQPPLILPGNNGPMALRPNPPDPIPVGPLGIIQQTSNGVRKITSQVSPIDSAAAEAASEEEIQDAASQETSSGNDKTQNNTGPHHRWSY